MITTTSITIPAPITTAVVITVFAFLFITKYPAISLKSTATIRLGSTAKFLINQ